MPANTTVPQHTHQFNSWFVLLLGYGATVNCSGKTITWRIGRVHKVPAFAEHGLFTPHSLLFVSFQRHSNNVVSASEDFQLV